MRPHHHSLQEHVPEVQRLRVCGANGSGAEWQVRGGSVLGRKFRTGFRRFSRAGHTVTVMATILGAVVSIFEFRVRSRASLELELIALRHQVTVLRRQRPGRPQLSSLDRLLWVWLYRIWPQVIDAMVLSSRQPWSNGIARAFGSIGVVEHDIAPLGAKRHANRTGENVDAGNILRCKAGGLLVAFVALS